MLRRVLHNLSRLLVSAVSAVVFTQCNVPTNTILFQDVNLQEWQEPAEVVFHNGKANFVGDLSVVLHVNHTFCADTVGVEVVVCTPDSLRFAESVTMPVSVEWGDDKNGFVDLAIPYRRDVRFAVEGDYIVTLRPLSALRGVEAAGVNFQCK